MGSIVDRPIGQHSTDPASSWGHPDPAEIDSVHSFVVMLRSLGRAAGFQSVRELARCAKIPSSTLADALDPRRPRLPPLITVTKVVATCDANRHLHDWQVTWQRLHADLDRAAADNAVAAPQPRSDHVPHQLPRDIPIFVGRDHELDRLDQLLPAGPRRNKIAPLVVIAGPTGVGKTGLAVHWAHRHIKRFPHGQLFLDLGRPAAGSGDPATPTLSLALRSVGVERSEIPTDVESSAALYRTLTYARRLLIVLDNATSANDVRPLIPAGAGCLVLVTSRQARPELQAHHDAAELALPPLSPCEAQELLTRLNSVTGHAGREQAAIQRLAALSDRRPQHIRAAVAADLGGHPQHSSSQ